MSGFEVVCDWLGRQIVSGELPSNSAVSVDAAAAATGVARTVVREASRVIEGLGLIVPRQRVGLVVQPASSWALLDPRVIRWRLEVGDERQATRELAELRLAVEPLAASLATYRRTDEQARELMEIAEAMSIEAPLEELIRIDQEFHHRLVEAAGNRLLVLAAAPIAEALRDHITRGPGRTPVAHELELHVLLATAVSDGDTEAAAELASRIIAGPGAGSGADRTLCP